MILIAFILGGVLLWWFGRLASLERRLRGLLLGAFVLRSVFALFLYAASYWQWPILPSLQTKPGFWSFGLDSMIYDYYGDKMVQAWAYGIELPNSGLGIEYFLVVALLYKCLGSHPLHGIIFNCWLATVTALLAYRLAARLFSKRAAVTGAALVAFWPSSLVWSAQLLKDSLCWLLIFAALLLIVTVIADARERGQPVTFRRVARWVMLGAVVILMTRLRFYLGLSLSAATAVVCLAAMCHAGLHRRIRDGLMYLGVATCVVATMLFARSVDSFALVSPRHPERGHVRLAERYWRDRDPDGAAAEYLKALALDGQYKEAYAGLAAMMMQLDQLPETLIPFQGDLPQRHDISHRAFVGRVIGEIRRQMEPTAAAPAEPVASPPPPAPPVVAAEPLLSPAAAQPPPPAPTEPAEPATSLAVEPNPASAQDSAVPGPGDAFAQLTYSVAQIDDQAWGSAQQMSPESLGMFRSGFVHAGGYSLMDAWAQISSPTKLIRYLSRALAIGFLAPFPGQWFDVKGSTGIMRALAGIEVLLVYWLLPAILVGSATVVRQRRLEGWLLLTFVLCLAAPMSLVVANLGTLFRLRLQFLLPLLLLGAAGNPGGTYRVAIRWIVGKVGRGLRPRPVATPRVDVPAGEELLTMSERRS